MTICTSLRKEPVKTNRAIEVPIWQLSHTLAQWRAVIDRFFTNKASSVTDYSVFFFNINTVCDRGPKSSLCSYVGIAAGMPVRTCFNDTGHSTGTPAHHGSIHIVNPPPPLQFIQATHACMHSFTGLWSIQTLQRYFSQRRKLGRPHKHASATHTTYARTLSTGHLLRLQWPPTSSPMCTP